MMSLSDREDHPKDVVLNIEQASLSFIANVTRPKRKYSYLDDIVNIYFQKPVEDIRPVLLSSSMSPNNRKKHSYLASLDSCPCFSQQYQGVQSISAASSPWANTCTLEKYLKKHFVCVISTGCHSKAFMAVCSLANWTEIFVPQSQKSFPFVQIILKLVTLHPSFDTRDLLPTKKYLFVKSNLSSGLGVFN